MSGAHGTWWCVDGCVDVEGYLKFTILFDKFVRCVAFFANLLWYWHINLYFHLFTVKNINKCPILLFLFKYTS